MNIRLENILFLLVPCFVCRLVFAVSRVKRIIDGIPLLSRTSGYNAVRYYVWISNGQECTLKPAGWLSKILGFEEDERLDYGWLGFRCTPDPTNILCGGSLITPRIVQTACHCLAMFEWSSDKEENRRAVLDVLSQGRLKVHLGVNQVKEYTIGMPTSKHFVHQKCSQMAYYPKLVVWDYGWIFLQFSIEEWGDFPSHWIDYAPQYTRDELVNIWHHTLQSQAVCLILGFGGAREIFPKDPFGNDDLTEQPYEEPSEILRHGWVYTEAYSECKNHTEWLDPKDKLYYNDDATWGCGIPFTRELRTFGDGDSGGPTACNNHYVGVNSQTKRVRIGSLGKLKAWIPLYMATRFALLENAIEYRRAFMEHIDHYSEFTKDGRNQPIWVFRPPLSFRLADATAKVAASSVRSYLAARLDGVVRCLLVTYSILNRSQYNIPLLGHFI